MKQKISKELEIEEDIKHQENAWLFQRIGMIVLGLLFILSFLGIAGNGPLSSGTEVSPDKYFKVEFEKLTRLSSPAVLNIIMMKDISDKDTLNLIVSNSFINSVQIQSIVPQPSEEISGDKNMTYSFVSSGNNPVIIRINYQYRDYGISEHTFSINNEELKIKQFVWP